MTQEEALKIRRRVMAATEPDTLPNLTLAQLQEHHGSLCQARLAIVQFGYPVESCNDLLRILRQEIEAKRAEERSERHHKQSMRLGGKTLLWAKVGGVAAAIGTIALLF